MADRWKGGVVTPLSTSAAFTQAFGIFPPGVPLTPPDPQKPRSFDFPVGINTVIRPRSYEAFDFPSLRAFANVELVRLAIETRKDQIERLNWLIRPKDGRKARKDAQDRIRKVERFFRKPDGQTYFAQWLRQALEDLFAIDAPAFEKRRNRGGDLIALEVIPGDTIKVLVDDNGRRPIAPDPAYQQIIKGIVWCDLTADEIVYAPRNVRPGHVYGCGPVEQIIVTINTLLRRQTQQLAYFTDGNLPAGFVNVPEGWTVDQTRDWQEWMDARLSGNLAERSKLLWAPSGAKYQAFKESPIKDEFDESLAGVR